MLTLALKGIVAGALCALPLGPAGLLCFHRALSDGRRAGLIAAAGLAGAHALWCAVVTSEFQFATTWLAEHAAWCRAGLGALLCGLAWRAGSGGAGQHAGAKPNGHAASGFAPAFALVGINPATAMTVAAAIWTVGVEPRNLDRLESWGLTAAIFAGGMMLWSLLTSYCRRLASTDRPAAVGRMRRIVAGVLLLLGAAHLLGSAASWS